MLNVNQVTSMLAKLPDAALQKYAQMHRADPYMLSLTVAESNRRKQMREQSQLNAAVAQGQPESVVDQKLAELAAPQSLPEEQGIGQLPTGDMNFADGGIVAFSGGGMYDAPYTAPSAGTDAEIPGMSSGDLYRRAVAKARAGRPLSDVEKALVYTSAPFAAAADVLALPFTGAANLIRNPLDRSPRPSLTPAMDARRRTMEEFMPGESESGEAPGMSAYRPRRAPEAIPAGGLPIVAGANASRTSSAPAGSGRISVSESSRTSAPAASGIAALDPMAMLSKTEAELAKQEDPARKQLEESGRLRKELAEEGVTGLEAIQKRYDDIYKGKRERLDKREGELGKMKNEGLGMALLQAGAAMMTTPGGIGQAIGKGVDVGSKQYLSGIQRLRDAQEKLADARDRLEEAEAARGEGSAREMLKARQGVKAAGIETSEAMIKHLMDTRKVNRETAVQLIKAQLDMLENEKNRAVELQKARIMASASGANSGSRDLAAALKAGNDAFDDWAKSIEGMTANADERMAKRQKFIDNALAQFKIPGAAADTSGFKLLGSRPTP